MTDQSLLSPLEIRQGVIAEIRDLGNHNSSKLPDSSIPHDAKPPAPVDARYRSSLEHDLALNGVRRRALQPAFERMARRNNPGVDVSLDECEGLETVGDAVGLVFKKANVVSEAARAIA